MHHGPFPRSTGLGNSSSHRAATEPEPERLGATDTNTMGVAVLASITASHGQGGFDWNFSECHISGQLGICLLRSVLRKRLVEAWRARDDVIGRGRAAVGF